MLQALAEKVFLPDATPEGDEEDSALYVSFALASNARGTVGVAGAPAEGPILGSGEGMGGRGKSSSLSGALPPIERNRAEKGEVAGISGNGKSPKSRSPMLRSTLHTLCRET